MKNKEALSQIALQIIQETLNKKNQLLDPTFALQKYLDPNFSHQNEFVKDRSRFIVAQCSRRAGKSNGLAIRFLHTLETHPGCFCPYIALTRESARNIMWGVLQEQDLKFKTGCIFTESNLTMTHPNGARLQLFGADMKNFIRRLKGIKTPGVGIDEAQDFGSHLQSLVDDVLTPTLTDYQDSWIAITGTPGPVPMGYFYEITFERKYGYSFHSWELLQNPYLPFAEKFIADLKKKRQWDDDHPTLLREWRNQWVLDAQSLLVKYYPEKNHYETVPHYRTSWKYIMGIDIGFKDSDAICVLAWCEATQDIYLVYEDLTSGQDISNLTENIRKVCKMYDISKMVIDTGGLGKKIAEEIIRRHQIPVKAADKSRKMENIALLNDWLRLGYFKAKKDSIFSKDSYKVQIDYEKSTPDKIIVKSSFHSDMIDAVLYAFRESPAFTYKKQVEKPKYGTPEWGIYESERMEQAEIEYFENEQINVA